jgi:signal transduction histidine kinase
MESLAAVRELSVHLQNIREEERKRIGREIHDELGQQLTAIKMDIAWIDKNTNETATKIKTKLKNTIQLLDGSNLSLRKILNELRTGIMDNHSLVGALEWQGQQFENNTGMSFVLKTTDPNMAVEIPIANCLFRILQEALTNITRHASATNVNVVLTNTTHKVNMIVEDDGKGFELENAQRKKTFGILGIKERVASLNGTLEIEAAVGKGTRIYVTIPLNKKPEV